MKIELSLSDSLRQMGHSFISAVTSIALAISQRQDDALIHAKLDKLQTTVDRLATQRTADTELASAARAAKPVIDETVAALDQITPSK